MKDTVTLSAAEYIRLSSNQARTQHSAEQKPPVASLRGPMLLGAFTLIFGIGGFYAWASTTQVSSASLAHGRIIVESNTKTVTHLDGGSLKTLLVKEGEKVTEGQPIVLLDATRNQSSLVQLREQFFATSVRLSRLIAEKDERAQYDPDIAVPEGVGAANADNVVATERRLFNERMRLYRDQISADRAGIAQLDSQRTALEARQRSYTEQSGVIQRDHDVIAQLQAKQLATKAALNDRKLQLMEVLARIAETNAAIAENAQKKAQLELALTNRSNEHFREISEQTQAAQLEIARLRQQIVSAEDIVAKAVIRSPQTGLVANIRVRTPGSAVISGQPIMDIVPDDQPMIVEGQARAMDIDTIHVGERAEIHLSAFGADEYAPLYGNITFIAPDSVVAERTGESYFTFRATIDEKEMAKQPNLFLYPGMSAEVYLVSGNRTALDYLAEPLRRSFNRAFREQ
ncbi:MAG: hypothetical protein RLZZ444_4700 [Pseudomonadota bacterium]|jgi:HlyD family secretion protein